MRVLDSSRKPPRLLRRVYTFANSLHGAHLGAIFHSMQAEVDFGERLLFLDGANSIVKVFGLINVWWRVFHVVWRGAEVWRRIVGVEVVEQKATRGEDEGRVGPCAVVAAGETKAEASMRCGGCDKTIFSSPSNSSSR